MKHGTLYAKEVKKVFNRLVREHGRAKKIDLTDPVGQLLLGILSRGTTETGATSALKRLRESVVDVNELRVSSPRELMGPLGQDFPQSLEKARDINGMLNEIFNRQHDLDLTFLRNKNRREARQYLEKLPGVDRHTVASVMLLSIGGHAAPVDDNMLTFLRQAELVDPEADEKEIEAFLERNIAATDAYTFYVRFRRYAESVRPKKKDAPAGAEAGQTTAKTKKAKRVTKPEKGRQQ
jgi:endonuclease III